MNKILNLQALTAKGTTVIENNLIPIYEDVNQNRLVAARDLWIELKISKDFSDWIKQQIDSLDFQQDQDFLIFPLKGEKSKGRPEKEYILTLDTAKHIAMASRTKNGKEIRKYFIEVEKRFRELEKQRYLKLSTLEEKISSIEKKLDEVLYKRKVKQQKEKIKTCTSKEQLYKFFIANKGKWFTRTDLKNYRFIYQNKFKSWFEDCLEYLTSSPA